MNKINNLCRPTPVKGGVDNIEEFRKRSNSPPGKVNGTANCPEQAGRPLNYEDRKSLRGETIGSTRRPRSAMTREPLSEPVRRISFEMYCSMWLNRVEPGFGWIDERRFDVAYVIGQHLDRDALTATIKMRDLAREAGVKPSTARRIVREMHRDGLMYFTPGGGRGNISTFRPLLRVPFEIIGG